MWCSYCCCKHTLITSRDEFIDASELGVQYGSFELAEYLDAQAQYFKPYYTIYVNIICNVVVRILLCLIFSMC